MAYTCPVCGYPNLRYPPADYVICPSCGTEFEYHDARTSHAELRQMWIHRNMPWHSRVIAEPVGWNAWMQLIIAGYGDDLPRIVINLHLQADAVVGLEQGKAEPMMGGASNSPVATLSFA